MNTDSRADAPAESLHRETERQKPFVRLNFILMAVCVAMIIVGFILMAGPGTTPEGGFNPDIFSTRRIVVGPTIAFLGFLLMAFAIVYTPRRTDSDGAHTKDTAES